MNPYDMVAAMLLWVASTGGAFWYGTGVGRDHEIANQAKTEKLIAEVALASQNAAAGEIAKIKPRNATIRQETEREIQTNTVYRDCRNTDNSMHLINEALTGPAEPAGGGKLPGAGAAE